MKKNIALLIFSTLLSVIPSTLIFADEERGLLSSALMSDSFAEKTKLDISGFASGGFTINTQNSDGYNEVPPKFSTSLKLVYNDVSS